MDIGTSCTKPAQQSAVMPANRKIHRVMKHKIGMNSVWQRVEGNARKPITVTVDKLNSIGTTHTATETQSTAGGYRGTMSCLPARTLSALANEA